MEWTEARETGSAAHSGSVVCEGATKGGDIADFVTQVGVIEGTLSWPS
ncbi:MAG: hypothetical protein SWE60_02405 [Thermodesulfobacteriota bacterium]|nr:hypothetical protein [Thermodesulfobacteriota bacterium]